MTFLTSTKTYFRFLKLKWSVTIELLLEINWILNKGRPRINATSNKRRTQFTKNLTNAAVFNRINTVVEMFSSGYINSTDISCRPSSIGRFSRCTLQNRVEIKFHLRAVTCNTSVRLPQNTLCREVPLL